jgi:hypothetical protein
MQTFAKHMTQSYAAVCFMQMSHTLPAHSDIRQAFGRRHNAQDRPCKPPLYLATGVRSVCLLVLRLRIVSRLNMFVAGFLPISRLETQAFQRQPA